MFDFPLWVDVLIIVIALRLAVLGLAAIIKAERKNNARKTRD